ncbi:MAG: hypothetical protein K0Q46_6207 [Rhodococcus erythropolis]|nr:hypothetical protein [Rhodococcus erythropolis]MDF2899421.1 hypothetical protein [Rhodococcus erythropolis]
MTPEVTAERIAEMVRERYPSELNERHDEISYIIDTGQQRAQRGDLNQEKGVRLRPAITLSDTSVRFEFSYTDADLHGNTGLSNRVLIFQAVIIGYNAVNGQTVTLPENEAEGWARAILGPELSTYAHKVEGPVERPRKRRSFPVLVDREHGPIAAPPGFDWSGIILEKIESNARLRTVPLISG